MGNSINFIILMKLIARGQLMTVMLTLVLMALVMITAVGEGSILKICCCVCR